ncbi:MAG: HAD family hydrolase [Thermoplasmata archaeon]|nr:MAG: HAD family hydrolase [Thermoplasmata archaeon]
MERTVEEGNKRRKEKSARRAVFLDRDGVLAEEVGHLHRVEDLKVIEGAPEALRILKELGYVLIIVTNQGGIAKGMYGEEDFWNVTEELQRRLGVRFDGVYFCPHHPEGSIEHLRMECRCRKPSPGMILKACEKHKLDLGKSWLIGDHVKDIQAARRAGVWRTILVMTGYGKDMLRRYVEGEVSLTSETPHYFAQDILFAAKFIRLVEEKGDPIEVAQAQKSEVRKRAKL